MRRIYADLHLCPNSKDPQQVSQLITKAGKLGYRLIAMVFPSDSSEERTQQIAEVSREAKMDIASRVDLKPRSPNELIDSVRRLRRRFEIIAVNCWSKNVARQAAKDRRVDLLNFPSLDFRERFFDRAEAELASNSLASLEIDLKPLLTLEGPTRVRLLSNLRKEVAIANEFHVPIVVSSGVSGGLLMRKPKEVVALTSLFDLDKASAIEAASENAVTIVRRNRDKLGSRFVAPGIRIIRRGRDP
jgi:RNase P/RNase MRP subunit p30